MLLAYMQQSTILTLNEDIILKTTELRQQHRIKTPDAIIATTALTSNYTLFSRNLSDFKYIKGLSVIDPHTL
jgi:predicted nucleic acid-binding protein